MALGRDGRLRLFRRIAVILVSALLPTMAIVVPLSAAAGPLALAAPSGSAGAVQNNPRWAGYGAVGGSYHDVTAVWQVPGMPRTKSASYAFFWVGLGGDGYGPVNGLRNLLFGTGLEQIGIVQEANGGQTAYWPFWEVKPGTPVGVKPPQSSNPHFFLDSSGNHLSVEPGDFITASVSMTNGTYYMNMSDSRGTNNTIWTTPTVIASGPNLDNHSAEAIMEDPTDNNGQQLPLADFGRVSFDGVSVDGNPIGSTNPTEFMIRPNPGINISPIGANGDNFTINTPAPPVPRITSVGTYTNGVFVYFNIQYADPGNDAEGFGFVGVNGSGWAEENHPFSSPSYGIVGPDSIAYPFNEGCGTAQQYDSYVEAWIYDTAGDQSKPVVIHLVCTG